MRGVSLMGKSTRREGKVVARKTRKEISNIFQVEQEGEQKEESKREIKKKRS